MKNDLTIVFQSTPSAWRETLPISYIYTRTRISIHSLRMEGDPFPEIVGKIRLQFQSTPSAWRETSWATLEYPSDPFQSTPSAWRETNWDADQMEMFEFQSTPSAWRETTVLFSMPPQILISIHSLRMEGDCPELSRPEQTRYFNPLPPHGGRLWYAAFRYVPGRFQSTPSAWRETFFSRNILSGTSNFNPLPPHGGRQPHSCTLFPLIAFQSTPSAWRETYLIAISLHTPFIISIHSLRMEGDVQIFRTRSHRHISIHSLRMEGDVYQVGMINAL